MSVYFQLRENDDYTVVDIHFDITNGNMKLINELFDQMENEDTNSIILNFKDVSVIDSLGLGKLLKFFQKMKSKNKKMVFCHLNNQIKYLFHITQLESIFHLVETEEEAFNQL